MNQGLTKTKVYLAGICSLIVTIGVARFSYTPLLPIMQEGAGLTESQGGWLATANYMGYMMGVFIAASLNNLHYKYRIHQLYLILGVLTTGAMVLSTNAYFWAFLRFVSGMSSSGGMILASGLILKWLVQNHHRGELGIHFSGIGISIILSALLVEGVLLFTSQWPTQWLVFAAVAAVFAIPSLLWMPDPSNQEQLQTEPPADNPPTKTFRNIMLLAYFCAGYGYVVSATFIVDIVSGLDSFKGSGNFSFVVVGIAALPAVVFWDRVARKLGYLKTLVATYGIQIVGIVLPALTDQPALILLSALLYGGTFVACVSLVLTMAGQFYPSNPAKFMGKMTLAYGVAQIIAPAVTGYLAETFGNYNLGLYISAFVMLIGTGLILVLLRFSRGISIVPLSTQTSSEK